MGQCRKSRRDQRCRIAARPPGRAVGAMRSMPSAAVMPLHCPTKKARGARPGLRADHVVSGIYSEMSSSMSRGPRSRSVARSELPDEEPDDEPDVRPDVLLPRLPEFEPMLPELPPMLPLPELRLRLFSSKSRVLLGLEPLPLPM